MQAYARISGIFRAQVTPLHTCQLRIGLVLTEDVLFRLLVVPIRIRGRRQDNLYFIRSCALTRDVQSGDHLKIWVTADLLTRTYSVIRENEGWLAAYLESGEPPEFLLCMSLVI